MQFSDQMGRWAKGHTNREKRPSTITLTKHDIGRYLLLVPMGGSLKYV